MADHGSNRRERPDCGAQLVLARYQEDLDWLQGQNWPRTVIYAKGRSQSPLDVDFDFVEIRLPNIGREVHTYLHHIVHNYDSLADITIFSQAGIEAHVHDARITSLVRAAVDARSRGMTGIGVEIGFRHWDGIPHRDKWARELESGAMLRSEFTPGEFYRWIFNEEPPPCIPFCPGAILGVHRHAVLARPRSFYQRLLEYFERLAHHNPEEGHYMERFWVAVFEPGWANRAPSFQA